MAKAKYLKELIKAYKEDDRKKFKNTVNEIIKEEEQKNHFTLAKQLKKIMENYEIKPPINYHHSLQYFEKIPKDIDRQIYLIDIKQSKFILDDVILSQENRDIILDIIDDHNKATLLKANNLKPKSKILFCGPPGCGKTLTAEAMAGELQLPLVYTKLDAIVSSYLGDTSSNLRKVFDYLYQNKFVVFFDEFDAIGKSRDDDNEHGEIKRVVNSFLQMIDTYYGESIIIAATNHQGLLDKAVWRRFDEIIYFDKPKSQEIVELLKLKLRIFPKTSLDYIELAKKLINLSHSEIEMICYDAIKFCVKNNNKSLDMKVMEQAIKRHERRKKIYSKK